MSEASSDSRWVAPGQAAGGFEHHWRAVVLRERPLILPRRHYVYPREAEEVERGALEVMVEPAGSGAAAGEAFLATCALGFADPTAPTGIWTSPDPHQICAVAGGYVYLIDTADPQRFEQVAYRPVLSVHAATEEGLLLFVGSRAIVAYGKGGLAWESPRLSDEGVTIQYITDSVVHGTGWHLLSDQEQPFALDLRTGTLCNAPRPGSA